MSVLKSCKYKGLAAIRQIVTHQSADHDGVSIFSAQYSLCVQEVLITLFSLRARPVLMHFLSYSLFPPPSAPSACFSAESGFWQSYLLFDPNQSPSYLQLLNHKHFIGSTLTLTDKGRWGFGVKCLRRLVDAGLLLVQSVGNITLSNFATHYKTPSCAAVALPQRETLAGVDVFGRACMCMYSHMRAHI